MQIMLRVVRAIAQLKGRWQMSADGHQGKTQEFWEKICFVHHESQWHHPEMNPRSRADKPTSSASAVPLFFPRGSAFLGDLRPPLTREVSKPNFSEFGVTSWTRRGGGAARRKASAYTEQHNTEIRVQTSMPREEFEPKIPVSRRWRHHNLDRAVTVIGSPTLHFNNLIANLRLPY
jgi:hypothetical protein